MMNTKSKTSSSAVLIAVTMASLMTSFSASSINVALPVIGKELGISALHLSWIPTMYLLSAGIFLIPMGRLADITGRKKVFSLGVFLFSISSLLCMFSFNSMMLISFRFLQGIGASMVFASSGAILMSAFPQGERGKAIGYNTASVYIGLSIGPFFGGILTHYLGWKSIFLISFVVGMINVPLILTMLKDEWKEAKGEPFDYMGSVLYAISLSAVIIGFSFLPKLSGIIMTIIGIAGILIFIVYEYRIVHPVLKVGLFVKNRVFAFSNLAAAINYSATASVSFFLSLFLQTVRGLSPREAGFILVTQPLVQAVFSPLAGKVSDRIEPRLLSTAGMSLTTVGLFILSFFSVQTSVQVILLCLVLFGFGFALFASPNTNAVMSSVEKKYLGIASSTLATMRIVGQMMSMAIATMLVALFLGDKKMTAENSTELVHSMSYAFNIFTVFCLFGIYFSMSRGKVNGEIKKQP